MFVCLSTQFINREKLYHFEECYSIELLQITVLLNWLNLYFSIWESNLQQLRPVAFARCRFVTHENTHQPTRSKVIQIRRLKSNIYNIYIVIVIIYAYMYVSSDNLPVEGCEGRFKSPRYKAYWKYEVIVTKRCEIKPL